MLLGFEHVNLVASNMDRTLAFYVGLLGLTLRVRRRTDSGGEVAFVDTPGGGMEIVSPPGPVATPARLVPRTEAGIGHIAFTVDDVDAEFGVADLFQRLDRLLAELGIDGCDGR